VLHKSIKRVSPHNSANNQWPIRVISTSNCSDILHNLKFDRRLTKNKSILPSKIQYSNGKLHPWKKTTKGLQVKSQKKTVMIGDSHARGLNYLGQKYAIFSTFMPGAGLQNITKLAKSEPTTFTNSDTVIVCGGSNDVNRDMSQVGLSSVKTL